MLGFIIKTFVWLMLLPIKLMVWGIKLLVFCIKVITWPIRIIFGKPAKAVGVVAMLMAGAAVLSRFADQAGR